MHKEVFFLKRFTISSNFKDVNVFSFFFSSKTRIFRILVSLLDAKKLIKKRDRVLSRRDELLKLTKVRLRMLQFVFLFLFFFPSIFNTNEFLLPNSWQSFTTFFDLRVTCSEYRINVTERERFSFEIKEAEK